MQVLENEKKVNEDTELKIEWLKEKEKENGSWLFYCDHSELCNCRKRIRHEVKAKYNIDHFSLYEVYDTKLFLHKK